jgi:hypothetical protein
MMFLLSSISGLKPINTPFVDKINVTIFSTNSISYTTLTMGHDANNYLLSLPSSELTAILLWGGV